MSCEVTFIEECFVAVWMNTKEAGVGSMWKHMCLYLALKHEGMVTLRALQVLVLVFILMPCKDSELLNALLQVEQ